DPRQVTLEQVTISDGTMTILQEASGRAITLGDIDSEVSARSLAGPWRINASLAVDGRPATLSASTGTAGSDGAMRVRLTAAPRDYPFVLEADGDARLIEGQGNYAGTFRLRAIEEEHEEQEGEQIASAPAER